MSKQGYVYIAIDEDTPGYCKIGRANDVAARQRTLNSGKPKPTIKIVASAKVDDNVAVEAAFHQILHHRRKEHGEWFNIEEHHVRPMLVCFEKLGSKAHQPAREDPVDTAVGPGSWHEDGWRMHCAGATQAEIAEKFEVSQGAVVSMKKKMRDAGRGSEEAHRSRRSPAPLERSRRGRDRDPATPKSAYRQPILDVLNDLGGRGQARVVLEHVEQRMKGQLKQADYERLNSGQKIWSNRAQWMRQQLKQDGLLKSDSPHGWWELA